MGLSLFKIFITVVAIVVTFVKGRHIQNKRKRIIVIMAILLAISTFSNRSIYWFLYWDGPYHGQVVDADTGEPIEGAAVAGIWELEGFILFITSFYHFANAKETVTDADGKFKLPLTFAFTFWPFSVIDRMKLVVFKPGYDSHPPSKQMVWTAIEKNKYGMTNHEYRVKFTVKCKMWKKCLVRLNKAMSLKEVSRAFSWSRHALRTGFGTPEVNIKNFIKITEDKERYLKEWKRF
jgi:hypothetical protein